MNTGKLNTIDDLLFYFVQVKGDQEFFGKISNNYKTKYGKDSEKYKNFIKYSEENR